MSAVTNLKTQITKKTNEINEILKTISMTEKTLHELKANYDRGKSYIEGLEQALSLFDEEPTKKKEFKIRPGTQVDTIYNLLKNSKRPMHINNICEAMGKEPNKSNRQSLTGTIGKLVREKQYFNRPEPGTYGLIEWGNQQKESIAQTRPPVPAPPQRIEDSTEDVSDWDWDSDSDSI